MMSSMARQSVAFEPLFEAAMMVDQRQAVAFASDEVFDGGDPGAVLGAGKEDRLVVASDGWKVRPDRVWTPGADPRRWWGYCPTCAGRGSQTGPCQEFRTRQWPYRDR